MHHHYDATNKGTQVEYDNAVTTIIHHRELAQPAANIVADVIYERHNQLDKWGDQRHLSVERYLAILVEEVGEVAKEICEKPRDRSFTVPNASQEYYAEMQAWAGRIRTELIQLAAVAVAMVEAIDFQNRD